MSKKGVMLSQKHGLNPTIPLCIVCEKPKNEVVMLGAAGDILAKKMGRADGDMPMYAHIPGDFEPCDACKAKGVTLLEQDSEDGDACFTGRLWLVSDEFIRRNCVDKDVRDRVLKARVAFIPREIGDQIQAACDEDDNKEKENEEV